MAAGAEVSVESPVIKTEPHVDVHEALSSPKLSALTGEKITEKIEDAVKDSEEALIKNSDSKPNAEMQMKLAHMMKELKLNPLAEEFVPSSYNHGPMGANNFVLFDGNAANDGFPNHRRRRNNYSNGRKRTNGRALGARREDSVRRTVYVSDIDHSITEEQLAALFSGYGQVVDCRVCGDPHSRLRFAFVEFADERSARLALSLSGMVFGFSQLKVLPSKTAILPVNPIFLPRSEDEREMCARTVYCTNIDKKVSYEDVKSFFETKCGEVSQLRLLGDHMHFTGIAFVEFSMAESALLALDCCGQLLGSQPIRVSPSKTPVRPRINRPGME